MKPIRIQRKRAKGWKLPPNTVCVDRSSKWGNPFVVGVFGDRQECISAHLTLLHGYVCATNKPSIQEQKDYFNYVKTNIKQLRGKNLACFCKDGESCHADLLLEIANS